MYLLVLTLLDFNNDTHCNALASAGSGVKQLLNDMIAKPR
jgi:hypothetical protein